MNKTAVLYKSKYGATKKYAAMLKEELSCDIYEATDYKRFRLKIMTVLYLPEQSMPVESPA